MPVEVFYSYAHEDETLRDELEKHLSLLKRRGLVVSWHDRRIGGGQEWRDQIDAHARSANIILLLVSADFLASDYCYDVEMTLALERHARDEAIVIPIILRPVDWSAAPFAHLQALPRDAKAVTTWANRDEAFANIAQGIREVVLEFGGTSPSPVSALLQKPGPQQRVLDAAMPSHVVKDQATELQALIRMPDSAGLKGVLQNDEDAEARPEDVLSKQFPITFPRSLDGAAEGVTAQVTVSAPDFVPPTQTKQFIVPPEGDSEVISFFLRATRTGTLKVLVELQWQDALRGARRLLTECVADATAMPATQSVTVVRMPMAVGESRSAAAPMPSAPRPPRLFQSKTARLVASGALAATIVVGIFNLQRGTVSQPPSSVTMPSTGAGNRVLWEKNFETINDPRPTLGSSTGSWTNKEALLRSLQSLDLSRDEGLARKRQELIRTIERAETNPSDPTYNLQYTPEIRNAEEDLKREIRNRAIDNGVDVTRRRR